MSDPKAQLMLATLCGSALVLAAMSLLVYAAAAAGTLCHAGGHW